MTWTTRPRSEFADLSAIASGTGSLVLLIHGVGLRAEAWNRQIDALSPRFHTVAVDMPGHGGSALPDGTMTLSDFTDAIVAGLDGPALVIGHSMGAMIALDMAIRYPRQVRGVAAMNAIFNRCDVAAEAVKARAASLDGASKADPSGTLERWFGEAPSPERDACRAWLGAVTPAAYRMAYRVFAQEDGPSEDKLASLACPALFLTGSDEPNSTPDMSRAMAALAPKGRALIIENAAHMMPMTNASEVTAALFDFAREVWR